MILVLNVVILLAKTLVAALDTPIEILTSDIVYNVADGLLTDALTVIIRGVLINEFAMPGPLGCSAAFDCRPMTALDCESALQVWIPSYHV